ncbi:MAG: hypothetical protein O2887_19205 [Bacteroidetes bacterium]|nr:hypothetical protein [Bacteroidota bacterium]
MKKIYSIVALSLILISCSNQQEKIQTETNSPVIIGSASVEGLDGFYPIVAGDTSLLQLWKDYIQALNDRNQEKIAEMNADDVKYYSSKGNEINGIKALMEFQSNSFATTNPKWNTTWMIANSNKDKDGIVEPWLTTGSELTEIINGDTTLRYLVIDTKWENGKIKIMYAYTRASVPKK